MEKGFILSLVFAAIIAIFALNNSEKVFIDLFFTEVEMSQAIIILISALFGAVVAAVFSWVKRLKFNKSIKNLNNEISNLKASNEELKSSVEAKDNQIKRLSKEIVDSPYKGVKSATEDKKDVTTEIVDDESIEVDRIIEDEN